MQPAPDTDGRSHAPTLGARRDFRQPWLWLYPTLAGMVLGGAYDVPGQGQRAGLGGLVGLGIGLLMRFRASRRPANAPGSPSEPASPSQPDGDRLTQFLKSSTI
jgi:hypothetical protein